MAYTVIYSPEANDQIKGIFRFIAKKSQSRVIAKKHTDGIVNYCDGMANSPKRGRLRSDLRPGLRITNYNGSTVIAFYVDDERMEVVIVGVYYGGQDWESSLQE